MSNLSPKVWVAVLADYNNGRLLGEWINAAQEPEDLQFHIDQVLKKSKYPNVTRQEFRCTECHFGFVRTFPLTDCTCPECGSAAKEDGKPYPSAEEWAFHDFEDFGGYSPGEYCSVAELSQAAIAIEEHGELYGVLRGDGLSHDEAIKKLEDDYFGEYEDLQDFGYRYVEDTCGMEKIPEIVRSAVDWEEVGRELCMGGGFVEYKLDNRNIAIFLEG